MARKGRRWRPNWIVVLLVSIVAAFCVLTSLSEKDGLGMDLPRLQIPGSGFLQGLVEDLDLDWLVLERHQAIPVANQRSEGTLEVHYQNMGQADSILILGPEKTALIDCGENDQGDEVLRYLAAQGVEHVDYLIGTHPHSDHIGGMDTVVDGISVGDVILPEIPDAVVPTTKTYTDLLEAIERAELAITPAQPGLQLDLGGGAVLTVLGPVAEYKDLNNLSVVSRLDFGATSFLFTGDAEAEAEQGLLDSGAYLKADVLDVGHHGSKTSSSPPFLNAADPYMAVISCGLDNSYGHPSRQTIERLEARGVRIYRTDLNGVVVLQSDGEGLVVQSQT